MSFWNFFNRGREFKPTDTLPFISSPTGEKAIELRRLDIEVVITGLYSETQQTMVFHNPNSRDLETELCFPLPDGAAVCAYALDVDGQLVEGVIVAKEKARQILDAEVRKGADPGLIEQAKGNVYRTRIYPIPAGGTRTVRLAYISDLAVHDNDAYYHLPLSHAAQVDEVKLRVDVIQNPVQPEIGGFGNLSFNQWDERWSATASLSTANIVEDLVVRLPQLPAHFVSVEHYGEQTYFNVSTRLKEGAEDWLPKHLAIAWDASGSRQNIDKDIELLRALAVKWPQVRLDLLVFRDAAEDELRNFNSFHSLIDFLQSIAYDGATDINALDFHAYDHDDIEVWLLFSDGLHSFEKRLPADFDKALLCINSQAQCNSALLSYLASRHSKGLYINLVRTPIEQAVADIASLNNTLEISRLSGCEDIEVKKGNGRLSILGRLKEECGQICLQASGQAEIKLEIVAAQAGSSRNIARAWAGQKTQQLALDDEQAEHMLALSREFGLVTPGTSLLVLETLEQYLEYDIEPPPSRAEIHRKFMLQRRRQLLSEEERKTTQLSTVLTWWQERINWWQSDFKEAYVAVKKQPDIVVSSPSMAMSQPAAMSCMDLCDSMELDEDMTLGATACAAGGTEDCLDGDSGPAVASIKVQAWSPQTPYLTGMRQASAEDVYQAYLQERPKYQQSPSFFLDCGDYLFSLGQGALAKRVLSNLLEMQVADVALLRVYGWRLQQGGELDLAIRIFEQIRQQRDDEPQSHRDLALALSDRWQLSGNKQDAIRAMHLLYDVITRSWQRFPQIELIALMELNRLIKLTEDKAIEVPERIDPRLIRHLDLDVRISMSWDADLTDVDLHVFEPDGGHAYYGHNRTLMGGLVSLDFTQGYGPEEYILRQAMPGTYLIKAHYYGSHQQTLCGPCTISATIFTNYGRPQEQRQVMTLRLEKASDQHLVGEITIDGSAWESVAEAGAGSLDKFKDLHKGMDIDAVKAVLGAADDISGSDIIILKYTSAARQQVELHFKPKLIAVKLLQQGATVDLI